MKKNAQSQSSYTKKEFNEDLTRLYHAAWEAKVAYQIWIILMSKKERPKYGTVLQWYSNFFLATARAQFACMLMSLCKIYDHTHGKNFKKIIKEAKDRSIIPKDFANLVEQEILALKAIVSKLHILRNNFYAHIQLDSKVVFKKADIKPNDFEVIIEKTMNLFDRVAVASNAPRLKFQEASATTYRLLDVLKKDEETPI